LHYEKLHLGLYFSQLAIYGRCVYVITVRIYCYYADYWMRNTSEFV